MTTSEAIRELRRDAGQVFEAGGATAIACVRSRDPDEASSRLSGVYGRHRLSLRGRREGFDMRLQVARAGRVEVARLGFGAEVALDQPPQRRFTLVTAQLSGRSEISGGGDVFRGGPGMVVVDSADAAVEKRFSHDSCRLNLRLEQARLEAKCVQLFGRELCGPLIFRRVLAPGSAAQARWLALLRLLFACVGMGASNSLLADQLEETATLFLLTEVPHSAGALLQAAPPAIAPRHVKRAEDFIRAHAADALTLGEIADAVGVSIRSLTEAFRRSRQITPMAFQREQRLLGVRAVLLTAGHGETVTAVAVRWGFGNLGRFAADYRKRFGESPSETLRRSG